MNNVGTPQLHRNALNDFFQRTGFLCHETKVFTSISRGGGNDDGDQAPKKQLKYTKNELRLESAKIYTFIQLIMKSILSFLTVNFF